MRTYMKTALPFEISINSGHSATSTPETHPLVHAVAHTGKAMLMRWL